MADLSPIALFVYNRPAHTKLTLEALQSNELAINTDLYIFSDAAKSQRLLPSVEEVRQLFDAVDGFKSVTIVRREDNYGLAKSIISGVTSVIKRHGKVIVLEDDLVTSKYFLRFMNQALSAYANRPDIFSVTGFSFPLSSMSRLSESKSDVFLNIRPMSWSWATWSDRWEGIDWTVSDYKQFASKKSALNALNKGGEDLSDMLDLQMKGKLDSWYIRWTYHAFKVAGLTVYPATSFVNNIGHDNSGVHCIAKVDKVFCHSELNGSRNIELPKSIKLDQIVCDEFNRKFNYKFRSKVKRFLKKIFGL